MDNVVKQATAHSLITGPETLLNLFTPTFVSDLTRKELEHHTCRPMEYIMKRFPRLIHREKFRTSLLPKTFYNFATSQVESSVSIGL